MTAPAKPQACRHPSRLYVFEPQRGGIRRWCPTCGAMGQWNYAKTRWYWTLPTRERERRAARKEQVK